MLYYLSLLTHTDQLEFFRLFKYLTFRSGGAVITAILLAFIVNGSLIQWLKVKQGKGQPIRADGPQRHIVEKAGTPTMGGLLILLPWAVSTILWANLSNQYVWIVLFVTVSYGVLGFADDYLKVSKRSSDGVSGYVRLAFEFAVAFHERNRGKGGAVRTGFEQALGDVIVVQDADLEYDPNDWSLMLPLIADRKIADVVYGSRFESRPHRSLYFHHYMGNKIISLMFSILYNQTLSDIEVCYKMFTREVLKQLVLTSNDFGFEIQISAQIARAKCWRVYEVGISYYGRTYNEGKKINWRDGVKALGYLVKFRVTPMRRLAHG